MSKPRILRTLALALAATGLVLSCLTEDVSGRPLRQYRRPWRSGVVSFGIQGQYGFNTGETSLTKPFEWGPGMAINARYAVSRRYSVGVRFEVHNFGASEDSVAAVDILKQEGTVLLDEMVGIDELRVTTAGIDLYMYFNRSGDTMHYLNFGSGLYQLSVLLSEDPFSPLGQSARIERDHVYLMAGAGMEHFVRRSVAFDFNGKVFAYLGDSEGIPMALEMAAGLQVYFFD